MRYQALALLLIVLVSSYLFRENSVFSQSGNGLSQLSATAVDTINLNSSPQSIQQSENTISSTESLILKDKETPSTSSVVSQISPSEPIDNSTRIENAMIEKPIIENSSSTPNSLCAPVTAKIYIAQTIDGGNVLYEKNSQNRWPIASVSKLMTAVIALENLNQSDKVTITQKEIDDTGGNNTLMAGDTFTISSLVRALLIVSSNDAAYALADAMGQDAFVQKMNEKAKEISMSQTTYFEPSGLSYLNQSTAHDLYSLLIYIQKHDPLILDITRIKTLTIKNLAKGMQDKKLVNINEFAGRNDFFGGKTGFIDQSGGNLVSLFKKDGKMVYVGVLGSSDRFNDSLAILSCIQ